ncbi:MAG: isoamylase early set domain-containing protein [Gracilimonas sp.]
MDKQELLRKYLDEELSPSEEREALHIIADDEELRKALKLDIFLYQSLRKEEFSKKSFHVPDGFSERVMMKLEQNEGEAYAKATWNSFHEQLSHWWQVAFSPKSFQLRPALAVLILLILLMYPVLPTYFSEIPEITQSAESSNAPIQTVDDTQEMAWVRFVYVNDNADEIAIAGDFNDWEPKALTEQQINGEKVWTGFFSIPRGEHKYMFVVDGEEWVTDPLANMYKDDGFGNQNAIIYL